MNVTARSIRCLQQRFAPHSSSVHERHVLHVHLVRVDAPHPCGWAALQHWCCCWCSVCSLPATHEPVCVGARHDRTPARQHCCSHCTLRAASFKARSAGERLRRLRAGARAVHGARVAGSLLAILWRQRTQLAAHTSQPGAHTSPPCLSTQCIAVLDPQPVTLIMSARALTLQCKVALLACCTVQ